VRQKPFLRLTEDEIVDSVEAQVKRRVQKSSTRPR
jgi:hypothetical protein